MTLLLLLLLLQLTLPPAMHSLVEVCTATVADISVCPAQMVCAVAFEIAALQILAATVQLNECDIILHMRHLSNSLDRQ